MSPFHSWLLVVGVIGLVLLAGLVLDVWLNGDRRYGPPPAEHGEPGPRLRALHRRDWLLEQLDRADLTVEERCELNAEIRFYNLPDNPFLEVRL